MSDHEPRKFSYLGTSDQQIIPVPPDITERGFREILRVWRKPADKSNPERVQALIRGTYEHPGQWTAPLATIVRTLVGLYFHGLTPVERDRAACALLGGALSLIAADNPDLNADMIESDIGDMFGPGVVEILPPEPVQPTEPPVPVVVEAEVPPQPQPTAGPEGVSEAQPANAPMAPPPNVPVLYLDERALPLPPELLDDPKSRHIMTIWEQPDVPGCEDCPDCGQDHMGRTYVGINTAHLTEKAMGRTLGTLAKLHVQFKTDDRTQRAIGYGEVMQHFHSFMVEGMTKQ